MTPASVQAVTLQQWIALCFRGAGVPEEEAQLIAAVRLEAALRDPLGFDAFAARSLAHTVERLQAGGVNPRPAIRLVREQGPLAVLDGDGGVGQLVGVRAMEHCLRLAETYGLAYVGVRRSSSLGAMAYYAMMAAARMYIGLAATNTELRIGMPPWGGVTPTLGNNPFAVAIPHPDGRPLVIDMSLTATEPQGATPGAMAHRQALLAGGQAARPVMGGHKGYALAVALEVMCGVLTGAAFARDHAHERISAAHTPPDLGHLFMALDIARLMPLALFQERMADFCRQVLGSEVAPGSERIWLPGELEAMRREARLRDGVPVPEAALAQLESLAGSLGVSLQ